MGIYIPREGALFRHDRIADATRSRNALSNVCMRIPHKGYDISLSCDDSCGTMLDLTRSDIRVFKGDEDVTQLVMGSNHVYADAQTLKRALRRIDELTRGQDGA